MKDLLSTLWPRSPWLQADPPAPADPVASSNLQQAIEQQAIEQQVIQQQVIQQQLGHALPSVPYLPIPSPHWTTVSSVSSSPTAMDYITEAELRDRFATEAMRTYLTALGTGGPAASRLGPDSIAAHCYRMADAMLQARRG